MLLLQLGASPGAGFPQTPQVDRREPVPVLLLMVDVLLLLLQLLLLGLRLRQLLKLLPLELLRMELLSLMKQQLLMRCAAHITADAAATACPRWLEQSSNGPAATAKKRCREKAFVPGVLFIVREDDVQLVKCVCSHS